jgi:hypothetical protein
MFLHAFAFGSVRAVITVMTPDSDFIVFRGIMDAVTTVDLVFPSIRSPYFAMLIEVARKSIGFVMEFGTGDTTFLELDGFYNLGLGANLL